MIPSVRSFHHLTHHASVPALGYLMLLVALLSTILVCSMGIRESHRELEASAELLARLEGRAEQSSSEPVWAADSLPPGSPFLEGHSVTVAGAALLQRLIGAIARVGGNVVSSEIEPQQAQTQDGFVRAVATCELEQAALQPMLYDLEAGMPFLFIDQLVAQAPQSENEGGRMRVLIRVSALWRGSR